MTLLKAESLHIYTRSSRKGGIWKVFSICSGNQFRTSHWGNISWDPQHDITSFILWVCVCVCLCRKDSSTVWLQSNTLWAVKLPPEKIWKKPILGVWVCVCVCLCVPDVSALSREGTCVCACVCVHCIPSNHLTQFCCLMKDKFFKSVVDA